MLIAVEGPGSAGRHQVAQLLVKTLKKNGFHTVSFDGETSPFAALNEHETIDPQSGFLARLAHHRWVERNTLKEALALYPVVVVEKWTRNTLAYYGGALGVGMEEVVTVADVYLDDKYKPDAIVYCTADQATLELNHNPKSKLTEHQHLAYSTAMQWLFDKDVLADANHPITHYVQATVDDGRDLPDIISTVLTKLAKALP